MNNEQLIDDAIREFCYKQKRCEDRCKKKYRCEEFKRYLKKKMITTINGEEKCQH